MIKGRVAFYARSFHFRARPNPLPDSRIYLEPRARAINRGTRPVISARLCRAPPRGIPKNRKGRHIPGHVPFRVACFFLFFWYHAKGISAKPELSTTMNLRSFLRLKDRLLTRERIKFDVSNLKLILCSGNYVKVNGSRSLEVKGHIKGKESVYLGLFRKKSFDRHARGSTS